MAKHSAGILVYRNKDNTLEVLLIHPGGPFWAKKDNYAWSIPKGEYQDSEELFEVAKREFEEEIGQPAPDGRYKELGSIKQAGGKIVTAWAIEKDFGQVTVTSNTFTMEWPPKSGQQQEFPEVDRAEWFSLAEASQKLHPGQNEFLQRLAKELNIMFTEPSETKPLEEKLSQQQISLL